MEDALNPNLGISPDLNIQSNFFEASQDVEPSDYTDLSHPPSLHSEPYTQLGEQLVTRSQDTSLVEALLCIQVTSSAPKPCSPATSVHFFPEVIPSTFFPPNLIVLNLQA